MPVTNPVADDAKDGTAGPTLPAPLEMLGPAPLLEGEDGAFYDRLNPRIAASVEPKDILEEIWVRARIDVHDPMEGRM